MKMVKQENMYMRGNIIKVLKQEGWFDYLNEPRSIVDVANHFQYKDFNFLERIINVLLSDGTLEQVTVDTYRVHQPLDESWIEPPYFPKAALSIYEIYSSSIPKKLHMEPVSFSGGLNLFNWDDALIDHSYEQARRAAFTYTNAWKKSGKFLDVGCGNGWGTSAIWTYFYDRGAYDKKCGAEIWGIDVDEKLLNIAQAEFAKNSATEGNGCS